MVHHQETALLPPPAGEEHTAHPVIFDQVQDGDLGWVWQRVSPQCIVLQADFIRGIWGAVLVLHPAMPAWTVLRHGAEPKDLREGPEKSETDGEWSSWLDILFEGTCNASLVKVMGFFEGIRIIMRWWIALFFLLQKVCVSAGYSVFRQSGS